MEKNVMIVTGAGQIGLAIARRMGYGMKIYRANKLHGPYKLLKTTKKNTFTDKKVSAKKVYYYKVFLWAKSGSTPEEHPAMMDSVPVGAMVVTVALR